MTITDQIKAAAAYETWKLGRVQEGGDFSVDAYERHLLSQGFGDRLDRIHELVAPIADDLPIELPSIVAAALGEIARLSDTTKEVA